MVTRNGEVTMKQAIENLLHAYKLKGKVYEAQVVEKWGAIVGHVVEKHTRNVYLKNRKLFIQVDSPVLKQELSYNRSRIMQRVNEELQANVVDEVILL